MQNLIFCYKSSCTVGWALQCPPYSTCVFHLKSPAIPVTPRNAVGECQAVRKRANSSPVLASWAWTVQTKHESNDRAT